MAKKITEDPVEAEKLAEKLVQDSGVTDKTEVQELSKDLAKKIATDPKVAADLAAKIVTDKKIAEDLAAKILVPGKSLKDIEQEPTSKPLENKTLNSTEEKTAAILAKTTLLPQTPIVAQVAQ